MRMRLGSMGSFDRVSITQHVNTVILTPALVLSLPRITSLFCPCQQACLCGVSYHHIIPMLCYNTLHVLKHQHE